MEPCVTYQNIHHLLMVVIDSQQGETCWSFSFKLYYNEHGLTLQRVATGNSAIVLPDPLPYRVSSGLLCSKIYLLCF